MDNKTKTFIAASVLAAISQLPDNASAMNPNLKEGFEKCYGVSKAGKNDCKSIANKHGCQTLSRKDDDPNEWVKVPEGLCDKLTGGSTIEASQLEGDDVDDGHDDHDDH